MERCTTSGKNRTDRIALAARVLLIVLVVLIWESLARNNARIAFYTSFPSEILTDLFVFTTSGELLRHVGITLSEAYLGLLYGALLGVLLGILCGQFPPFGRILAPIVSAVQGIPQLTLAPLYILWFGIGLKSKVILSALMVFFNVFYIDIRGCPETSRSKTERGGDPPGGEQAADPAAHRPAASMPGIPLGVRIGASVCNGGRHHRRVHRLLRGLGWMVTYASRSSR
jgi:NitT/TauT family transport system permease protein